MSKPLGLFGLFVLLLMSLSGPGNAATSTDHPVLHVAGWDVYADPQQRNKTIGFASFEARTGYRIEYTPLTNLDEILNFAESQNNIDVLIISNEGIEMLYRMNLVDALDLKQISHYQDLHHSLRYTSWSQFEGKIFAVPWAWGPTGLLYNTQELSEPDSWNILWDPKYKGKVTLWDDISMIWTTALALGYTNVYNLTHQQLDEVRKKLIQLNDQVAKYYSGEQEEMELLASGQAVLANSWFDPSARLARNNKRFNMIIPKEGAVGMFDSYLITRNSKLKKLAHIFINHQISPEVQLEMTHVTGLAPSNIESLGLMNPDEIKALHLDDQNYFSKMILWDVMPRKQMYEKLMEDIHQDLKKRKPMEN